MPLDHHAGHVAIWNALIALAEVAREISQDPAHVTYLTLSHHQGRFHPSVHVTMDVFDALIADEQAEPDDRISGLRVFPHSPSMGGAAGWVASCTYRGTEIITGTYPTRPSFDPDLNLEAELAASVAEAERKNEALAEREAERYYGGDGPDTAAQALRDAGRVRS